MKGIKDNVFMRLATGVAVIAMVSGCVPWVDGSVEDYYYTPADPYYSTPIYGSPWYDPRPPLYLPGDYPWYSPGYYPPSFNRPPRPGGTVPPPPANNRPSGRPGNTGGGTTVRPSTGQRPGAVQSVPSTGGSQSSGGSGVRGGATGRH